MCTDWRLFRDQDKYLHGARLIYHAYDPMDEHNDHDHCGFCMEKFSSSPNDLHYGYSTKDNDIWICDRCFNDFKDQFEWKVIE